MQRDRLIALGKLLRELQLQGFAVDVERQVRLERLLARVGIPDTDVELRTLLCPIFATSPREQEVFYRIFAQSFSPDAGTVADGPVGKQESERERDRPESRRLRCRVLAGAAPLALLAGVFLWHFLSNPSQPSIHDPVPTEVPSTVNAPASTS